MSILSCENFVTRSGEGIEIKEEKNAIEINFLPPGSTAPSGTGSTNVSTNITGTVTVGAAGDNRFIVNNNYISNSSTTASWAQFRTVGYRIFFKEGYLRCIRKEISDYAVYASDVSGTINLPAKSISARNVAIFPYEISNHVFSVDWYKAIKDKVIAFAARKGLKIPEKFCSVGKDRPAGSLRAVLDWLSVPLVREIDSVAFCSNLAVVDRGVICPGNNAMNFKQLVTRYYGTTTSKMLQEIWNSLTVGDEETRTVFQLSPGQTTGVLNYYYGTENNILETNDEYMVQIGSRALNPAIFTIGPAIFKKMGFDWLYEWLKKVTAPVKNRDSTLYAGNMENNLEHLLRYVSPRKMVTLLSGDRDDVHYIPDVSRMLADYPDASEIPASLKGQFPNGLEVNFKFKTVKELHDKISTQYTIIEVEASKKLIPTHPAYLALNDRQKDGLRLVVPVDTSALAVWGKLLNICVASYGDRAARAETLILGVEKNGEIKYCIEFYSVIIAMMRSPELYGVIEENGPLPTIDADTTRVALPALEEKHMGVVPPDVTEDTFLTPYMIQFRSSRNGDPDKEDRNAVIVMLSNWVEEFKSYYEELGDKAFYRQRNTIFNADMMHNMNGWIANQHGQPDQLVVDPQMYRNLQQAFAIPQQQINVPPPPEEDRIPFNVQYNVRVVNDVVQNNDVAPLLAEQNPARFQEIANEVLNGLNAQIQDAIIGVDFAANAAI